MKDWEISESYLLPRILYLKTRSNTLPNKLPKPHLRCLSLNEENVNWTAWRRSDYFYPEMIPEPDYSDSEDGIQSEDDEENSSSSSASFPPVQRHPTERLRELAEVYAANVDAKKPKVHKPKSSGKKGGPESKTTPKVKPKPVSKAKPTSKATDEIDSKTVPKTLANEPKISSKSKDSSKAKTPKPQAVAKTKEPSKEAPPKPAAEGAKKPTDTKVVPKDTAKSAKKDATKTTPKDKAPGTKTPPKTSPVTTPKTKRKQVVVTTPTSAKATPESAAAKASPTTQKSAVTKRASSKSPTRGKAASKKLTPVAAKAEPETTKKGIKSKKTVSPETSQKSDLSEKSKSPVSSVASTEQSSGDEELIKPKRAVLPHQQSTERQKLHQELKFSQKYGKIGASKTELQLALERYTENKMKRELLAEEKSSLEKILEIQAKKIEMQETLDKCPSWMERLQRPPSSTWSNPKTDEFFRVHARVVSSNILAHCFLPDDERNDFSPSKTAINSRNESDS